MEPEHSRAISGIARPVNVRWVETNPLAGSRGPSGPKEIEIIIEIFWYCQKSLQLLELRLFLLSEK